MGQGMMSGYRDALNLSWKLISVIINSFPKELLESYEEERKPHSRFVVEGSAAIGKLMSAYAEAIAKGNPSDVPQELVDRGYGSFSLPPLEKGLFYKGYSDTESMAGNLFPQPLSMEGIMCKERLDSLLGKGFCVVSTKEVELMPYQKKFYEIINANFLVIEKSMLNDNPWLNKAMSKNDIYILRPDRHIFGSTSDKITFEDLTEDLRERLSL
jgi:3-(3-hydroxy-phenyl)propionate hydroxylase